MDLLKAPSLQSLLESDRGSHESLLIDSLQLDIEELDDVEYSLPPVGSLPTLESVLSELESDPECSSMGDLGTMVGAGTPSHSSVEHLDVSMTHTPTHSQTSQANLYGSLLRHVVLQGLSTQIQSASEWVNAGLASVISAGDMIAVATTHGHILCFDAAQTLRWCNKAHCAHGAVSAANFNQDCTRLLAGFARGLVVMLNTSSGDTIRSLSDCHAPNTGVIQLRWTSPSGALCLDSGGSVWALAFTRRLGIRGCDSRCLFSGARGEVCTLEPLLLSEEDHPLRNYSLAAFATLSKVIIVSVRPRLRVIWTQPLPGPPQYLPLLAWQLVVIQSADSSRNLDPVLAHARGSELHFHQIIVSAGRIRSVPLRHLSLSYNILALHWLGPRSLACLDARETLRLLDVRSTKELEAVEMSSVGMVYGSAFFKGLATGGNVSPAFALAGTHACYNSIAARGAQLFVLGNKGVHAITVRSWSERLTHLSTSSRWTEALSLILEGYRAAYDRPRRQAMVRERAVQLINNYISKTYGAPETALADVMKCCVDIGEQSLLWGELWERLSDSPTLYLSILSHYIDSGAVTTLAPYVAQALVDYYIGVSPKRLQELLLKIDVTCLDLHQVLSTCRNYKMYSAFIYVTTRALNDYTLPITELSLALNSYRDICHHDNNLENGDNKGLKLDHYLTNNANMNKMHNHNNFTNNHVNAKSNHVASPKYEKNNMALMTDNDFESLSLKVDHQCPDCKSLRELGDTLLVYISGCLGGKKYPSGDMDLSQGDQVKHEVLRVLTATHSHSHPDGELPYPYMRTLLNYNTREALNVVALAFQEPHFSSDLGQAQRVCVVNILLEILVPEHYSSEAIGCLLCFISQQISEKSLPPDTTLLNRIIEYLTAPLTSDMSIRQHSERQQAWIDLLTTNSINHIPHLKQVNLARKASCYRVLEVLLETFKNYNEIVRCYLLDRQRQKQVFSYLNTHAKNPERKILKQIEENLDKLLTIDSFSVTKIIADNFVTSVNNLADKISSKTDSLFLFINGLIEHKVKIDADLSEAYLDLLSQRDTSLVEVFLQTCETYRPDKALAITKKYNLNKASAYLFEKQGDYISAFQILFADFKSIKDNSDMEASALEISNLCSRGSLVLSESQRESLWFPFLEQALSRTELRSITRILLHAASSHVQLNELVQLIIKSGVKGKFGDIKQVLTGMLANSHYETVMLEASSRVLSSDLHQNLAKKLIKSRRALLVKSCLCLSCKRPLCTESDCVLFGCGHVFHKNCQISDEFCPLCGQRMDGSYKMFESSQSYEYENGDVTLKDLILKLTPPRRPDLEGSF